jgi:hypothetical protein
MFLLILNDATLLLDLKCITYILNWSRPFNLCMNETWTGLGLYSLGLDSVHFMYTFLVTLAKTTDIIEDPCNKHVGSRSLFN